MKITKRQLKALIESVLLEQEQKKKSGIFSRIKSFFRNRKLDKSIFKDIDKEDFPSVYFDRFDDYTKEKFMLIIIKIEIKIAGTR